MSGGSLLVMCAVFQVPWVLGTEISTKIDTVEALLNTVEAHLTRTEVKLADIEHKLEQLLQLLTIQGTYLYLGPGYGSAGSSEIAHVTSDGVSSVQCYTVPDHPISDIHGYTGTSTPNGVLLCGGRDASGTRYNQCYHLNLQTNPPVWEHHSPLTSARHAAASVPTADGWLLMGGYDGGSRLSSSEILVGGLFVPNITLPRPVMGHCLVQLNTTSYLLIEGVTDTRYSSDVYMFDLTGTFTKLSPMKVARYRHACTLLDTNTVLVVGGIGHPDTYLSSVEMLDLSSLTWTEGPALPSVSWGGVLQHYNEQVLYVDGTNGKYLQLGQGQDQWEEVGTMGTMGTREYGFSAVWVDMPRC